MLSNCPPLLAFFFIPSFFLLLSILLTYKKNKKENFLKSHLEDLQGRINLAYQQLEVEESRSSSLRQKLKRYDALALLTEKLNQHLSLNDTIAMLLEEMSALFGKGKYVCRVYLIDNVTHALSLQAVKGNAYTHAAAVKEKWGDIFDQWALKHTQPLLVEDTANDFRFDFDTSLKKKAQGYPIGSIIASCLMSQASPSGILRLDAPFPRSFTLEDLRLLATIADIAGVAIDNSQYYQNIKELAIRDSLTNVYTRAYALQALDEEIKRCRAAGDSFAIIMIDIDFFKRYNDSYGHLAGDRVLKNLCLWLNEYLHGKNAIIGRYGGEEFLAILPSQSKQEAFAAAENLRAAIQEKRITLRRVQAAITISAGVACFPQDALNALELLSRADSALYEAKKTGRNRVCVF